jgi:malonyl-CoA decarboxylase
MVNYLYEVKEIERNHEAYANEGVVAVSRSVRALLKATPKVRAIAEPKRLPAPEVAETGNEDIAVPIER